MRRRPPKQNGRQNGYTSEEVNYTQDIEEIINTITGENGDNVPDVQIEEGDGEGEERV